MIILGYLIQKLSLVNHIERQLLPGAIAAKRAYPNRQVVGIAGDGAFEMVMQDFATAVQYDFCCNSTR
jgi:glyoxylate carboligase